MNVRRAPRALPRRQSRWRGAPPGALTLTLALALAAPPPAAGSFMAPPSPYRAKDFTLVKRDGVYHLFYIRRDMGLPQDQSERDLGHAVSTNLFEWTQLPPVLEVRGWAWDDAHVWAPSIVESDGVYYMFYAGVTRTAGMFPEQERIGLATSTDLMQWNRLDAPIFSCKETPWAGCQPDGNLHHFRDPFVMRHPGVPGGWLLYYVADPESDPGSMVVAAATSGGDLTRWTDAGPLWVTHRSWSYNELVESPHLFEHEGTWFLFFTTNSGQPISYATGPDPLGPLATWTYRGRLSSMLGFDTAGWYASEHFRDGLIDYFCFVSAGRIHILRMDWRDPLRFGVIQPDLFHVIRMAWSAPSVRAGEPVTLRFEATGAGGRWAHIETFELDADGSERRLSALQSGLPDSIPMAGDLTLWQWWPPVIADGEDLTGVAEIVVRTRDRTAESPVLRVLPPAAPLPPPGGSDADPVEELLMLRLLRRSPLGAPAALLVELAAGGGEARLELVDVGGRSVRRLLNRRLGGGATVVVWDGLDERGVRVPAGVYFARLVTSHGSRVVRVPLVR